MIGQTISHYRVIEKLGEGGMGIVYKAEDTSLDRPVALKFLAAHAIEDPEHKARFVREAKASARLDHQNICPVYEIDEADGHTFLAMAYLEGQTVKDKVAERPLKLDEALDIAVQTAQGLQAAHEKDIVHRDIKSATRADEQDTRDQYGADDRLVEAVSARLAKLLWLQPGPVGASRLGGTGPPETPHGDLAAVGKWADPIRQLTATGRAAHESSCSCRLPDWFLGNVASCGRPASAAHCLLRLARLASTSSRFERLSSSEPPWYGTRMPGGVTGKAREGLPMSILSASV